jgi:outer membrane lipoprotein-sorting protein
MRRWIPTLVLIPLLAAAARSAPPAALEIADKLEARFRQLTDYECVMESELRNGKKVERGIYRVWFRKPDLIRVKVEQGNHRGSQFAVTKSGKVRAHGGGLLKSIVVTMSKTDKRLRSVRGTYGWEADFGTYCRKLRERLRLTEKPDVRALPGAERHIQITLNYQNPADKQSRREIWTIDSGEWLLTAVDAYENGTPVERVQFRDYRENTGLKDGFFNL